MRLRTTLSGNGAVLAMVVLVAAGVYFGQKYFLVGAVVIAVLWLYSLVALVATKPQLELNEQVRPQLVAPGAEVVLTTQAINYGKQVLRLLTLSEGSTKQTGIRSSEQLTFIPRLNPDESVTWQRTFITTERGPLSEQHAVVTLDDPWGWLQRRGTIDAGSELLVHPEIYDLQTASFTDSIQPLMQRLLQERQLDQDIDFSHLRDYQVGDDIRLIHWKTSARRGQAVVLMGEQSTDEPVSVLLNLHSPRIDHNSYERALSATASIVSTLIHLQHRVHCTLLLPEQTVQLELADAGDLGELYAMLARLPRFEQLDTTNFGAIDVVGHLRALEPQPFDPQFYIGVEASELPNSATLWCCLLTHQHSSPRDDIAFATNTLMWVDAQPLDTVWLDFWAGRSTQPTYGGRYAP